MAGNWQCNLKIQAGEEQGYAMRGLTFVVAIFLFIILIKLIK